MLRTSLAAVAAFCTLLPFTVTLAMADDWLVTKLRGKVLQLVDGTWQPLGRGDVVSDERVLRTLRNGRAELQRGAEVISLGPETQIQIHDKDGKQFTTVQEYFGTVEVEAEVRSVQHFAVQTPFLAAVVKGTRFTVSTDKTGSSVEVQRGHVEVRDGASGDRTVLAKGQEARVGVDGELDVEGSGALPTVVDRSGKAVSSNVSVGGNSPSGGVGTSVDVSLPSVTGGSNSGVSVGAEVGGGGVGVSVDAGPVSVGVEVGGGSQGGGLLGVKIGLGR